MKGNEKINLLSIKHLELIHQQQIRILKRLIEKWQIIIIPIKFHILEKNFSY